MTHPDRKRIVITGLGAVSPNGNGAEAYARALASGASGLRWLDQVNGIRTAGLKSSVVGYAAAFEPASVLDPAELKRVPRLVPMALAAAREALAMAHLTIEPDDINLQRNIGLILGTGGGGMAFVEEQYRAYYLHGKGSLYSITAGTHGNLSGDLSIALRLRGPSHVVSTGCASSTDAIGYAMMMIRGGTAPMMLAGGADTPISEGILVAFEKMRVVSTRRWLRPEQASRPFSADRDGFVLGEGAWMFLLEELDHARHRNAPILAELAGYASTCDAYHRVQIDPDLAEPVRAIDLALADARLAKDQIDYINLHGTGTELNDRMETAVLKRCFGPRIVAIPASATKSLIGHPQGAGGAAGLAATVLAMRDGIIHPTLNLDLPDPHCDLDYVAEGPRPRRINAALCNCIAFGSKNSALALRRL